MEQKQNRYSESWLKHICHTNDVFVSYPPSFVRLVDYLVITTLHSCVVNAVDEILTLLQVQAGQTPSNAIIQSWTHDSEAAIDCSEKEMDKKVGELFSTSNCKSIAFISVATRNQDVKRTQSCLCKYMYLHQTVESEAPQFHPVFMSELILDTNSSTYKPSEENFQV